MTNNQRPIVCISTPIHPRFLALLNLLAEQEHKTNAEMASLLLAEALRRSLAGDLHFPAFNLGKLFPAQQEELPTSPSNPPPEPPEAARPNDGFWGGKSIWCPDCSSSDEACKTCAFPKDAPRPLRFVARSTANLDEWKGRTVWCHDCTSQKSAQDCKACRMNGSDRPTMFHAAYGEAGA